MLPKTGMLPTQTLALLVCVSQAATGSATDNAQATTHAITTNDNGDDAAPLPDFDGDGTIGFGDFLIFAGAFGSRDGDEKYDARYDLSGDGEIGFSDFVIFAQNFGKEVPSPVVAIPDANLRAAIEAALDKATGAPITQAEMATLDSLEANDADISDLTGLEYATNLTWLDLASNNITDISVLEGLTNLTDVTLTANSVSDLASLAANTGLGRGSQVDVTNNPLNAASETTHIPALQARGVSVSFVPSPIVRIPDANLRAAIRVALGKANGAPITQAEMATLDSLTANKRGISDLTGLEYATNLTWLDLASNNITNISVLEGLTNLTDLILSENNISDLASLVGNTGLGKGGKVDVTNNPLNAASLSTHILALQARGVSVSYVPSPVVAIPDANLRAAIEVALRKPTGAPITQAEMATLTNLSARNAGISDLTGLGSAANLTGLRLSYNHISDISVLTGLPNLTTLNLRGNNITDLSPLSGLTNLTTLNLRGNNITDLSTLAANTGLGSGDVVDVRDNPLDAASISTHIPALQARGVNVSYVPSPVVTIPDANLRAAIEVALGKASGAPITVAEMKRLSDLTADDAGISDLNGLEFAANLWSLWLQGNVTDLSPLSGLTNLTYLVIANLSLTVSDLSPILGLTNLTTLSLRGMNITDISALAGLTNLTRLELDGNAITDLSPLSGLTNLTTLNLRGNNITDLSPLSGLTNLTTLNLRGNNITDLSTLAANTGLGSGDVVDVRDNPLDAASISTHIPELQANGVNVSYDEFLSFTDPQIYNDNVFVLPVSENIAAGNLPLKDYAARFYEHFNDQFDFLMFVPNLPQGGVEPGAFGGAFYASVKNEVRGIGLDSFFDDSWGSPGKLNGVIYFATYATYPHTQYGVRWSIFTDGTPLHELMHRWANHIIPSSHGSHWGFSSADGRLAGFDFDNLVDHGRGWYTAGDFLPYNWWGVGPYSPIELYLAGFIPPEEVPDLWVAKDGEWLRDEEGRIINHDNGFPIFTASTVRTYSIEDIIEKNGPRVPDHTGAQRDFRAAVILLISDEYPAIRRILERLSDDVSWLSYAGEDDADQYNFYEATRGRGTITMGGLSQLRRRSGAKIVVPRSFGMPPPPIVDHWEIGNGREDAERTSIHVPAEAEQP